MDTDDDRIEDAKKIVEWMPDWEIGNYAGNKPKFTKKNELYFDGEIRDSVTYLDRLWTDRNIQAEVLDEIEERGLINDWANNLLKLSDASIATKDTLKNGVIVLERQDSETIFDSIVKTLEGEVE